MRIEFDTPLQKVKRRIEIKNQHFYAWNAQLGPVLNDEKICQLALSFPQLSRCISLDLRQNGIRKVELSRIELKRIEMFSLVRHFNLCCNLLTCIDCQSIPFQNVISFDISWNRLFSITNIGLLWNLKELYLSHNKLQNLRFLRKCNFCSNLQVLDISFNKLETLVDIGELVLLEKLETISLMHNLLPMGHLIEGFVILACPNLKRFGALDVTQQIRDKIDKWSTQNHEGIEVLECVHLFREAFFGEMKINLPIDSTFINILHKDVSDNQHISYPVTIKMRLRHQSNDLTHNVPNINEEE